MMWLLAAPVLLLLVGLAALLPYASFRLAMRNGLRADGLRSTRRTQREARHLTSFLHDAVLVPLLALVLLQVTLFAVHHYVVPDTTLSELFGENHPEVALHAPDLEAWDEAIDAARRDEEFESWKQEQGLAPHTAQSPREVMVEHWPIHLVFVLLPLAYLAWFFNRRYVAAARSYHLGVVRRGQVYGLHATSATSH